MTVLAIAVIKEICEVLWPNGDKDYAWDSSTAQDVANVLLDAGFGPLEPELEEADNTCPSCVGTGIGHGPPDVSLCSDCTGSGVIPAGMK